MTSEAVSIVLVVIVHFAGLAMLLRMLFSGEDMRGLWPRDDGRGGDDAPTPPAPIAPEGQALSDWHELPLP